MSSSPLIVFALKEENPGVFTDQSIFYTGIGKVQAAMHLSARIGDSKPSMVINAGTAGSNTFPAGTVVHCREFIQRDMDCTGLGFPLWKVPFSDIPEVLKYGEQVKDLEHATCGTGDSFEINHTHSDYQVVDMEAYALASVCQKYEIPFACFKYISDGADEAAAKDWNEALHNAAVSLHAAISKYLNV